MTVNKGALVCSLVSTGRTSREKMVMVDEERDRSSGPWALLS